MTDLEKYETVNACETVEALEAAIISFTDLETGRIQGRVKTFDGVKMASTVREIVEGDGWPNNLTREFGIRQQALYLRYYYRYKNTVLDFASLFNKPVENTENENV